MFPLYLRGFFSVKVKNDWFQISCNWKRSRLIEKIHFWNVPDSFRRQRGRVDGNGQAGGLLEDGRQLRRRYRQLRVGEIVFDEIVPVHVREDAREGRISGRDHLQDQRTAGDWNFSLKWIPARLYWPLVLAELPGDPPLLHRPTSGGCILSTRV